MTEEELVEKTKELLKADIALNFLPMLEEEKLERLVACIGDRVGQVGD